MAPVLLGGSTHVGADAMMRGHVAHLAIELLACDERNQ
ncbi:Hypothetical protein A7982_05355 [Minicystis rosea]|nr:Hypothetical protein A7982_05355 [Minicystis rosea]